MSPVPAPTTGVWLFPDANSTAMVEAVVAAEALGVDEVWLGDEGPGRDPFALFAAAARSTSRVRFGVAVTSPYLRHPAATAAAALTLQELSGGRFVLGWGAGGGMALDPVGLARVRPTERIREAVRITRAVASGTSTDGYACPAHGVTPAPLPVVIGARGERLNRLASEVADGVFIGGVPLCMMSTTIGWARSVRNIGIVVSLVAAFGEEAFERVRPQLLWTLSDAPDETRARLGVEGAELGRAVEALQRGDDGPARRLVDDDIAEQLVVGGSAAQIAQRLTGIGADFQPDSLVLNLHANGDPVAAVTSAAEVFTAMASAVRAR